MKINKFVAIAVVLFGLLVGGLGAGVLLSQRPLSVNAAQPVQQDTTCPDDDDIEDEAEGEADDDVEENEACDDDDAHEMGDVDDDGDEATGSLDRPGITAKQAQDAAEEATGATALEVELENENGRVVYEVELDNGQEVMVDPADGKILGTEPDDAD